MLLWLRCFLRLLAKHQDGVFSCADTSVCRCHKFIFCSVTNNHRCDGIDVFLSQEFQTHDGDSIAGLDPLSFFHFYVKAFAL